MLGLLLIATKNLGKIKEYRALLEPAGIKTLTLKDFSVKGEPVENGATFAENALIKARFYAKATGEVTLADDGGLAIDYLNGEPGVYSRRWVDKVHEASDEALVEYTLKRLRGVLKERRGAKLAAVLAVVAPQGEEKTFHAHIEGEIAEWPYLPIPHGYPYRALFIVKKLGKIWAALTPEESKQIAHRTELIKMALPFIRSLVFP